MVSFFSSRKRQSNYQGFAKYNSELNAYNQSVAGVPQNGTPQQSVNASAGSAAVAALRLHQTPSPKPAARANSLSTAHRANSLKTYVYNPKPSYQPGQATIPNARRYSSMTARSYQNVVDSHNSVYNKRASSITSQPRPPAQDSEGEYVVTTQTTRVVDAQGRTQSITTKTTKTLPDGSNIIETTTKNISRSNSRTSSLRNNSLLAARAAAAYNLSKIDEDLQGFEYNYQLDNPQAQPHVLHQHSRQPSDYDVLDQDLLHNKTTLKLNTDHASRSASLTSSQSPQKPLKSILKNTVRPEEPVEAPQAPQAVPEPVQDRQQDRPHHAYRNFSNKPLSDPPKLKVPEIPKPAPSANINTLLGSPTSRNTEQMSNSSITSPAHSITFNDRVETISYDDNYEKPRQVSNQELYTKAMQVAMNKVYGDRNEEPEPEIPQSVVQKKDKVDQKISSVAAEGLAGDYKYENHHKDFALHSLRDDGPLKSASRKERVKEEKKQRKELEKQRKDEERQRKEQEKLEEKQRREEQAQLKKEAKEEKRSPLKGLFARKKRASFDSRKSLDTPAFAGAYDSSAASSPLQVRTHGDSVLGSDRQVPIPLGSNFNGVTPEDEQVVNEVLPSAAPEPTKGSLAPAAPIVAKERVPVQAAVDPALDEGVLLNPIPQDESAPVEKRDIPIIESSPELEAPLTAVETPQLEPNFLLDEVNDGSRAVPEVHGEPDAFSEDVKPAIVRPVLNDVDSDAFDDSGIISDDEVHEALHSPVDETEFHEPLHSPVDEAEFHDTFVDPVEEAKEQIVTLGGLTDDVPDSAIVPGEFSEALKEPEADVVDEPIEPESKSPAEVLGSPVVDSAPLQDVADSQDTAIPDEAVIPTAFDATPKSDLNAPALSTSSGLTSSKLPEQLEPAEIVAEQKLVSEPVQITSEPVEINSKAAEFNAEPVETNSKPVFTPKPVEINTEPVEINAEPVEIDAEPLETSAPDQTPVPTPSAIKSSKSAATPAAHVQPEVFESRDQVANASSVPLASVPVADQPSKQPVVPVQESQVKNTRESNQKPPSFSPPNTGALASNFDDPSSRSNPPSDASDDRSVQPSHSTIATREEAPVASEKVKSKQGKPKKVSKLKEKLYKYFVNSYDKQR